MAVVVVVVVVVGSSSCMVVVVVVVVFSSGSRSCSSLPIWLVNLLTIVEQSYNRKVVFNNSCRLTQVVVP
jgi:hypothetical protein